MNHSLPLTDERRAWFEAMLGVRLRPEVTRISPHEMDLAADSSPRINDGLGGRGRCVVCWRSGYHDIDAHVRDWKHTEADRLQKAREGE